MAQTDVPRVRSLPRATDEGEPSARPPLLPAQRARFFRRLQPGGQHLTLILGGLIICWLVVVFGRAAADAAAVSAQAAEVRQENAALQEALDAGRREIALLQSDEFVVLEARAYGLGRPGERPFRLAPGAPDPAAVIPLGAAEEAGTVATPLEDWLDLLFGD